MENKTVNELKMYCRENGLDGFSKYNRKQDLLNFINDNNVDKQMISDSEYARALLESEKDYYMKKQKEEYIKQREAFIKQREEHMRQKKEKEDINNKLLHETLSKQNQEYEKALIEDTKRSEMEQYKKEKDKRFAEKISGEELEKMRLVRLERFS